MMVLAQRAHHDVVDLAFHVGDHVADLARVCSVWLTMFSPCCAIRLSSVPSAPGACGACRMRALAAFQVGQLGEVDRALGGAGLQEAHQLLGLAADVLLRFLRAAADVRRQDHVGQADQRAVQRFVRAGGESRAPRQMAGLQRLVQRVDVDHGAARALIRMDPRRANGLGVHDVLGGLAARHVRVTTSDCSSSSLSEPAARALPRQLGFHVVEHHAHAFGQRADLRADVAVAHDAQRLAARFEAPDALL